MSYSKEEDEEREVISSRCGTHGVTAISCATELKPSYCRSPLESCTLLFTIGADFHKKSLDKNAQQEKRSYKQQTTVSKDSQK
jgi:hypothetical protein